MVHIEDNMHGSVDASDLGLAPGDFPQRGATAFTRTGMIIRRGDLAGYEYEAADGFCLTVHND